MDVIQVVIIVSFLLTCVFLMSASFIGSCYFLYKAYIYYKANGVSTETIHYHSYDHTNPTDPSDY